MRLAPLLLLFTACAGLDDGPCAEDRLPLALDEVSAHGFAADDILAFALGEHTALLALSNAEPTGLSVVIDSQGESASWTERSPQPVAMDLAETAASAQPVCTDDLSIPVAIALRSDDGLLDVSATTYLLAVDPHHATFSLQVDARRAGADALIPAEGYRDAMLVFDGTITPENGTAGWVRVQAVQIQTGARESGSVGAWSAP